MSIHVPAALFREASRLVGNWTFSSRANWTQQRRRFELTMAWPGLPNGVAVDSTELGGVATELLTPRHVDPERVLLFLHGGGYFVGSPRTHRALAGRLATALRAATYVPDYRLAPEHPFPAAFDDAATAYQALRSGPASAPRMFVAGDSTGGGLALALTIAAIEKDWPIPAALALLCPSIDFTIEAAAELRRNRREPIMNPARIHRFWNAYVDSEQRRDLAVSPLRAALAGLPPLVIDTAEHDTLRSQSRRLAEKAKAAGVIVRYREHPRLAHDFHCAAGTLRQADHAIDDVAASLLDASAL